jgi:hypothetical protein
MEEQVETYKSVIDVVRGRLERAKSVGKKKTIKNGLDVDSFTENILDKIGDNNIAIFYKKNILTETKLTKVQLPMRKRPLEVVNELFGWSVKSGRQQLHCETEEAARYLKVFIDAGLPEVMISSNHSILKRTILEFEKIKAENDNIIETQLESVLNVKLQDSLRNEIWSELFKKIL